MEETKKVELTEWELDRLMLGVAILQENLEVCFVECDRAKEPRPSCLDKRYKDQDALYDKLLKARYGK